MSGGQLTVEVDRSDLDRYLAAGKTAIAGLIDELATDLQGRLEDESSSASRRVSESWEIAPATSPDERAVKTDVFFAAFLARGTAGHDAATAQVMQFTVDGDFVRASFVAGIPANPFHERAIAATEAASDGIIDQLIAGLD